ncbi:KPN_01571 family protein [Kosakonia cowanii]
MALDAVRELMGASSVFALF